MLVWRLECSPKSQSEHSVISKAQAHFDDVTKPKPVSLGFCYWQKPAFSGLVWVVIHCVKKSCRDFKLLTVMSEPRPALRTVCSSIYYNSFFLLSLSVSLSVIMTSLRVPTHLEWNVILVLLILWNVEEGLGPGPLYQGEGAIWRSGPEVGRTWGVCVCV